MFDRPVLRILPIAAVAALSLITAATAEARTSVRSTISLPAGSSVTVTLKKGATLRSVGGGTATKRRGTIAITAKKNRVVLITSAKPRSFKLQGEACQVKKTGRAKLAVTCKAPKHATGALPTPQTSLPADRPNPTGDGTAPAEAPGAYRFAPYVDFSGFPAPVLTDSGARHISLGFVVQSNAAAMDECVPTWGGFKAYPAAGAMPYQLDQVKAFKAAGGDVVVSFGGAAGKELATVCTEDQLATAYKAVIDAYGVTHLDFDIEGAGAKNDAANTLRAKTIAKLQQDRPGLIVTYTIQTATTGPSMALIENAKTNGVALTAVNLMTMDYYEGGDPTGKMGDYAIQAATALHDKLAGLYPSLTDAQRWRMVGVTPMAGVNDNPVEVFTLADAQKVTAFATANHIGMLGLWSLGRDTPTWDYTKTLGAFTG